MILGLICAAGTIGVLVLYLRNRPMAEPQEEDFADRQDFRMAQARYFYYLICPGALVVLSLLSVSFFVAS